jgi:hypothetical protein
MGKKQDMHNSGVGLNRPAASEGKLNIGESCRQNGALQSDTELRAVPALNRIDRSPAKQGYLHKFPIEIFDHRMASIYINLKIRMDMHADLDRVVAANALQAAILVRSFSPSRRHPGVMDPSRLPGSLR